MKRRSFFSVLCLPFIKNIETKTEHRIINSERLNIGDDIPISTGNYFECCAPLKTEYKRN